MFTQCFLHRSDRSVHIQILGSVAILAQAISRWVAAPGPASSAMGATRALLTLRFPDGRILYVNGHQQAALVLERLDLGPAEARGRPDEAAQKAAVVEATMKVESLLGDGAPTPLAAAVRALRALNAACNSAKHGEVKVARRQYDLNERYMVLCGGEHGGSDKGRKVDPMRESARQDDSTCSSADTEPSAQSDKEKEWQTATAPCWRKKKRSKAQAAAYVEANGGKIEAKGGKQAAQGLSPKNRGAPDKKGTKDKEDMENLELLETKDKKAEENKQEPEKSEKEQPLLKKQAQLGEREQDQLRLGAQLEKQAAKAERLRKIEEEIKLTAKLQREARLSGQ